MNNKRRTWLKMGLVLLILVELGVTGFWVSYSSQASQGLKAIGIVSQERGATIKTWVNVEVVLSALGWLALVNAIAILLLALYVRNPAKFPALPLIFLIGSVALSIRGVLLSIKELSWLFVLGIVVPMAVAAIAIWVYKAKAS